MTDFDLFEINSILFASYLNTIFIILIFYYQIKVLIVLKLLML